MDANQFLHERLGNWPGKCWHEYVTAYRDVGGGRCYYDEPIAMPYKKCKKCRINCERKQLKRNGLDGKS